MLWCLFLFLFATFVVVVVAVAKVGGVEMFHVRGLERRQSQTQVISKQVHRGTAGLEHRESRPSGVES